MKAIRFFSIAVGICLSMSAMAQTLTNDGIKAQKALIDHLREKNMTPSIDTKDNSVCFKNKKGVFFWVTFDENSPVLYTIHRKGLKLDDDPNFKPSCAEAACNEVNLKHKIKCTRNDKRIEFILQTYAKNPSDFHGGFDKMLKAFENVDETFKKSYEKAIKEWEKDSIEKNKLIMPSTPIGTSPLKVSNMSFGNFELSGSVISDYDQPLRKSAIKYIKARLEVSSSEKGIFKIGMKIITPEGKPMVMTNNGMDYCGTVNIEISKVNKEQSCEIGPYGTEDASFWKAGEYKVEFYDFEKGALLGSTTFNIL